MSHGSTEARRRGAHWPSDQTRCAHRLSDPARRVHWLSDRILPLRGSVIQWRGYTFIELIIVTTIILILASAVQPLARVAITRHKEADLRRALREMRTAIDKYKDAADLQMIPPTELKVGAEGYPPTLDTLVAGVSVANDATGRKLKFLRRIPIDPMTGSDEWGMRSYQDKPDATRWGGQNVYDVFSLSEATALDGTKYRDW
jgi:general secretion pathway protein G